MMKIILFIFSLFLAAPAFAQNLTISPTSSTGTGSGKCLVSNTDGTAPTFQACPSASIGANSVTNGNLTQGGAATVKGNPTNATANEQDFTIPGLPASTTPNDTTDTLIINDSASGTLKGVTPNALTARQTSLVTTAPVLVQGVPYPVPGCGNPTWTATGTQAGGTPISIASPAVVTWTAHGQQPGYPVFFTTTGALPSPLVAKTTYYVSSAGLTSGSFEIAATQADALAGTNSINTSGTQSGSHTTYGACITSFPNLAALTHYTALSVFRVDGLGGGAGGCDNRGGGGAGAYKPIWITDLPQTAGLDMISGGGGLGCHAAASPITPTNGTDSIVYYTASATPNALGQLILDAPGGMFSTTTSGGHGGNITATCYGFIDNGTGVCIRQYDGALANDGGDGSPWMGNGTMGGSSIMGGPLNSTGGGGAEGSGSGYDAVSAYGPDGFHGRVTITCLSGCW